MLFRSLNIEQENREKEKEKERNEFASSQAVTDVDGGNESKTNRSDYKFIG